MVEWVLIYILVVFGLEDEVAILHALHAHLRKGFEVDDWVFGRVQYPQMGKIALA